MVHCPEKKEYPLKRTIPGALFSTLSDFLRDTTDVSSVVMAWRLATMMIHVPLRCYEVDESILRAS